MWSAANAAGRGKVGMQESQLQRTLRPALTLTLSLALTLSLTLTLTLTLTLIPLPTDH